MREEQKKTRYGIFVFFDRDGIVDDYVLYLLNDLRKELDGLTIICNGKLNAEGRRKFEAYTDEIICRENKGFDITAWKKAILEYDGQEKLSQYDEIVLFNDTFYGPLYPFRVVFEEMDRRDVDFWGLTNHNEALDGSVESSYGYIPQFLQSYFTVFRKKLVKSVEFLEYWKNIPENLSYYDAVYQHEVVFAEKFKNMGYKWEAYIDTSDLFTKREFTICNNTFMPNVMIEQRRLPILRRKIFVYPFTDMLYYTAGENLAEAVQFIQERTEYDTSLIWHNLLRLYNISDLKQSMHLNYVLPNNAEQPNAKVLAKSAVILHLYYDDLLDETLRYASNIPAGVDLYITTSSEQKKEKIEKALAEKFNAMPCGKADVRVVGNRGRDLAAMLVGCADVLENYEYVCFTHDKKTTANNGAHTIGQSFMHLIFENVLSSEAYIRNILGLFDENPCLGLLAPPGPVHYGYFSSIGQEWTSCFDVTDQLAKKLKLRIRLDPNKQPFVLGTAFWCRTAALKPLRDMKLKNTDFPAEPLAADGTVSHALERIMPYAAQSEGFYSGWVMTEEYASLEISNMNYMMSGILAVQQEKYVKYGGGVGCFSYGDFINRLKSEPCYNVRTGQLADPVERLHMGTVYFDMGAGFSPEKCISVYYRPDETGKFVLNYAGFEAKDVVGLRFDPQENEYSAVKLERFAYNSGLEAAKIEGNKIGDFEDYCLFDGTDPWFNISIPKTAVNHVELIGTIYTFPKECNELLLAKYEDLHRAPKRSLARRVLHRCKLLAKSILRPEPQQAQGDERETASL